MMIPRMHAARTAQKQAIGIDIMVFLFMAKNLHSGKCRRFAGLSVMVIYHYPTEN
jgi:hypothetical protein